MNKTAIKNFAIWARNKLIADISYKAGLLGVTENGIKSPLSQSTQTVQFFDIGTKEPSSITGIEIQQRKKLVEEIERKAKQSDYTTAYKNVIEEVAYTWFNRLIAIRFMEVNNYLPTRIRVLSSESNGKSEPDLVTHALEANLDYSAYEKDRIIQLKNENKLDELFRMLFIKQCNSLNTNLPELFEKTSDYTELLLNISFTDKEGVIYHLVTDIDEDDFNVSKEGQVEIIGWLYQYYNTEPKNETFALLKKNVKITKERIPAATQLFTPDWIVRYMVENSLGRLWLEGHPNDELKLNWKFYLEEIEQEEEVKKKLGEIREDYKSIQPEDIKIIDPAMGSGHILVYAFDVLMQIYESSGFSQREAAKSIVENNLYGLDIDNRAYQLAYFAVMMKARQYNRKIMNGETKCHIYAIQESNSIKINQLKYFGSKLNDMEKNTSLREIQGLIDYYKDAKEYGSIITVENYNWVLLRKFINDVNLNDQLSLDSLGIEITRDLLELLINLGETMARRYDVVVTNPPYMGSSGMSGKLAKYVKENYPDSKADLFAVFMEKATKLTKKNRYNSLITMQSWMFLSSYLAFRRNYLKFDIINMVHLGAGAFEDAVGTIVQSTVFTMRTSNIDEYKAKYYKLDEDNNRDSQIIITSNQTKNLYVASKDMFYNTPNSNYAYWISRNARNIFIKHKKISEYGDTRQGMATSDNKRFIRFWHEVLYAKIDFTCTNENRESKLKWFPYNKGGEFRKWYGGNSFVLNWENNGREVLEYAASLYGSPTRTIKSISEYFKECLTWPYISTSDRFGAKYQPPGFIFDVAGSSLFIDRENILYLCGLMCSKVAIMFMQVINPTMNFQSGDVARIPVIYSKNNEDKINKLVEQNIEISKDDWDSYEVSWDFKKHPLINSSSINEAFSIWEKITRERFEQIKSNEEELNRIFIDIYELQDDLNLDVDLKDITVNNAEINRDIRSFMSYSVGCMMGRYSLDFEGLAYAGGEWDFSKYSCYLPDKDNIIPISDDEYFQDDIVGRFITFVKAVYGVETLESNLNFIAQALGGKGNSTREVIRNYFLKDFYKDHCQVYQKRPIYWLFDSGKQNGFKALVYLHRYDENTIGNLRIDYLHRMQRIYENEIARMQDTIENSRDAREVTAATKRKEKLIKQLQETKEYDEKIAHLALARTSIDLDDGVKVNYEKVQTDRDGKKLDVLAKI